MKNIFILLIISLLLFSCQTENKKEVVKTGHEKPMDETLADLNRKVLSDSLNPSPYVELSQYLLKNGRVDEALRELQKAVSLDSLNFEAWNNLVDIYLLTGRYLDCESAMNHLLQLDPKNQETLLKMSKYFLVVRNYEESMRYASQVLSLNKDNAQAYYVLGANYVEQGDTGIAIKNLIQSTELDPNFYDSQLHLAGIYEVRSNPLAAEYYKNAIKIRPKHLPTQYCLGMFYQEKLHQYERALSVYNTILQQDSTFVTAYYNIGYIYLQYAQDPKTAIGYFEKAVHFQPNYVEALYNIGCCYELMNQVSSAKSFYRQALTYDVDFPMAKVRLNFLGN